MPSYSRASLALRDRPSFNTIWPFASGVAFEAGVVAPTFVVAVRPV